MTRFILIQSDIDALFIIGNLLLSGQLLLNILNKKTLI
jgi:hypothetical protein